MIDEDLKDLYRVMLDNNSIESIKVFKFSQINEYEFFIYYSHYDRDNKDFNIYDQNISVVLK